MVRATLISLFKKKSKTIFINFEKSWKNGDVHNNVLYERVKSHFKILRVSRYAKNGKKYGSGYMNGVYL